LQHALENRIAARHLGYCLFWNLRGEHSAISLAEPDVLLSAELAGIKNRESAWNLLDRSGDKEATLEEVITSVEQVHPES
jgi:hypothetical protein